MSAHAVQFHYAARSDVGLVRSNNQDSGYAGANLLVLADGMGGPAGGDIASSVALAHLVPLDTDSHPADSMLPLLREALMDAHEELTDRSSRDRDLEGLGTTCIALMRSGNRLAMVHIGDSRAYVLRGDTLTQVTTDHSFVQYLVDTGQITPEEAEHHPNRNVVLKILGDAQADVSPDETVREAVVGDRWMLCSDGLSGLVSPETIGQVMAEREDPGECAEELIDLALRGGGTDNITCVIADIVPAGKFPPAPPEIVGAAAADRHAKSRGGKGAAARAAGLGSHAAGLDDEDDETEGHGRSAWWTPVFVSLVTVLVIAAGWLSWAWSQSQYYAIGQDGYVVIHQGIPQSIGPWKLSHAIEVTEVSLAELTPVDQQRLTSPVMRSSRAAIDEYLAGLRRTAEDARAAQDAHTAQSGQPQSGGPQSGTPPQTDGAAQSGDGGAS